MSDISSWYQPETTKKKIFEGIYDVVIIAAKAFKKEKEVEVEGKKVTKEREVISLTFKTIQQIPFPDKTQDNIIVEQQYYFDVPMHRNALNGVARAFGISEFKKTEDFEGKVGIIGIINDKFTTQEGEEKYLAKMGHGLFSYAPMAQNFKIEFIANTIKGEPSEEEYKEWYKEHLQVYK